MLPKHKIVLWITILRQRRLRVTALRDRLQSACLRYHCGVDTLLNALDVDRDLLKAQTRRDELFSLVRLYKVLGSGWQ